MAKSKKKFKLAYIRYRIYKGIRNVFSFVKNKLKIILNFVIYLVILACVLGLVAIPSYYVIKVLNNEKKIHIYINYDNTTDIKINQLRLLNEELKDIANKLENRNKSHNEYLVAADLNGFYSILFTFIASLFALLGLVSWKTVGNLNKRFKELNSLKANVEALTKKQNLANWVQVKIIDEMDEEHPSIISFDTSGDYQKLDAIKQLIKNDFERDSWLEIILAKELLDNANNQFKKVDNILSYIESRDLLDGNTILDYFLHNFQGQLYWRWYKTLKKDCKNQLDSKFFFCPSNGIYTPVELLIKSIKYYEKSIHTGNKCNQIKTTSDIYGSIVNPLMEVYKYLSVIIKGEDNIESIVGKKYNDLFIFKFNCKDRISFKDRCEICKKINEYLEKVDKKDFNKYWDKARVLYYRSKCDKRESNCKESLLDYKSEIETTLDKIKLFSDKLFFIDTLKDEIKEKISINEKEISGFPGEEKLIIEMEKKLDNKKNLK